MRHVEVSSFGGPEVLVIKESADPTAGPGEVVIDVAVAGVQSLDTYLRRGQWPDFLPHPPPYPPGLDAAGTVAAIGDGVDSSWLGRRVVATPAAGGYADRVSAPVGTIAAVPDTLALDQAMGAAERRQHRRRVAGTDPGRTRRAGAGAAGRGRVGHGAGATTGERRRAGGRRGPRRSQTGPDPGPRCRTGRLQRTRLARPGRRRRRGVRRRQRRARPCRVHRGPGRWSVLQLRQRQRRRGRGHRRGGGGPRRPAR